MVYQKYSVTLTISWYILGELISARFDIGNDNVSLVHDETEIEKADTKRAHIGGVVEGEAKSCVTDQAYECSPPVVDGQGTTGVAACALHSRGTGNIYTAPVYFCVK